MSEGLILYTYEELKKNENLENMENLKKMRCKMLFNIKIRSNFEKRSNNWMATICRPDLTDGNFN